MERKQDLSWLRNWRVLTVCGGCLFAGFLLGMLIFGSPWHLPPAWGDIPTWITGIATTGLLIGAIITARYAVKAFSQQAQEIANLAEENSRIAAERRIAQAARVYTRIPSKHDSQLPHSEVPPEVKNGSDFPIFDAQFWYYEPGGISGPDDLGLIPPSWNVEGPRWFPADKALVRTILAFRDAAGVRWIRTPDGALKEQSRAAPYVSVLTALGVAVPEAHPQPPGPEGQHDLPTAFRRLDDPWHLQDPRPVIDTIMVYPGSLGILFTSDRREIDSASEGYRIEVTSSDPDNQGVYTETEEHRTAGSLTYTVTCKVWNYRDSPAYAKMIRVLV